MSDVPGVETTGETNYSITSFSPHSAHEGRGVKGGHEEGA